MERSIVAALGLTAALAALAAGSRLADAGSADAVAHPAFMPRPARGPRPNTDARLDRNDGCVECHADVASEWTHSLHRQAYEDPMVQAAFAEERDPSFCRSCHAPEAGPHALPTARQAAAGVACVTCHLDGHDEVILASPASPSTPAPPHPVRRSADFASPEACAGCHEFWFPHSGRADHKLKMQRTLTEHARSGHADRSCQSCHMPPTSSGASRHLDHGFAVAGQTAILRSALNVKATRPQPDRVALELSPAAVGHAVPTGDLFRRLSVDLHSVELDDDGAPVWSVQRVLARRFGSKRVDGHAIRVELDDERVGMSAGASVVEFAVPPELRDRPLRWELALERALDAGTGKQLRAKVWDRTIFLTGQL